MTYLRKLESTLLVSLLDVQTNSISAFFKLNKDELNDMRKEIDR
jgi:hypothetical protein